MSTAQPLAAANAANGQNVPRARARLMTADELAERWQVPKAHVYRLSREGGLPTIKLGKYYRYALPQIEAFEAGSGTAADAQSVRAGAVEPIAAAVSREVSPRPPTRTQ